MSHLVARKYKKARWRNSLWLGTSSIFPGPLNVRKLWPVPNSGKLPNFNNDPSLQKILHMPLFIYCIKQCMEYWIWTYKYFEVYLIIFIPYVINYLQFKRNTVTLTLMVLWEIRKYSSFRRESIHLDIQWQNISWKNCSYWF